MKYLGLFLTGIKLLYLLSGLKNLVEKWQARRIGALEQASKDKGVILDMAKEKAAADAAAARRSDAALRAQLLRDSPDADR